MRPSELIDIRALPLFQAMSEESFAALIQPAFFQRFPAHVDLIAEGDPADFLHVVVDGPVELYARHDGRETTLDILWPVTTFILAAVIRDEPYLKSARTLTQARVLMIPAPIVRDTFGRDTAFARAIVNELAERYRGIVRALKNEKLRTGPERLANWILQEDALQGHTHDVTLTIEKRTLASRLGMTPENLSRNLAQLGRHGVRSMGHRLVIDDEAALRRFAKPNALIDETTR